MPENGEKKKKELNYLLKSKNTYSHQSLWQVCTKHAGNFFLLLFWIQYCCIIPVKIESILNWTANRRKKYYEGNIKGSSFELPLPHYILSLCNQIGNNLNLINYFYNTRMRIIWCAYTPSEKKSYIILQSAYWVYVGKCTYLVRCIIIMWVKFRENNYFLKKRDNTEKMLCINVHVPCTYEHVCRGYLRKGKV